ncbi:hypothetical protein OGAPHI_004130 [Ogataea philodendri]|uniref:Protein MKT1 n=1 Tax=Ogataea philodendri TaxID=1378263 RepID=A0A9P8T4P3_9ASCO|nr:uncharacterized protein OGAPHI_004130 [Ogataea philodendri]KAH3665941.1 hypothetical protein OGAPHI_004130 [Ogataea philodendri]
MPIKSLEPYLFDLKTVTNYPLDVLKNATIGIEAEHYLSRLLTPRKEPNLEAIGGFPMTLKALMEADFKVFEELNITPVFVFPGLKTVDQFDYYKEPELLQYEKNFKRIWEEKSTRDHFNESFRDSSTPLALRPIMADFMSLLESKGVSFIVAPYFAWVELHYLLTQDLIHCIFGSTDGLLIEGVDKFIFSMELESSQFKYVKRSSTLRKLNLTSKQFRDISMCVGNGFQPYSLNIFPHIPSAPTFPSLHEYVLNGGSVYNSLLGLPNGDRFMEIFQKGCASLDFTPVLKVNGRVELLQTDSDASFLSSVSASPAATSSTASPDPPSDPSKRIPNDLHEVIGQRLPDELFFYQSVGLTALELSETLIHGTQVERLPLDMAVTPLYQRLITEDESLEMRGKTLNLFANSLNRYYQFKKLRLATFFNGSQEYEIVQRMTPPLFLKLKPLLIRHTTARSFQLTSFLSGMSAEFLEDNVVAKADEEGARISTSYEVISTGLLRTLYVYGFLTENDYKLTEWGQVLPQVSRSVNVETLLLLLIFFKRFQSLKADDILQPTDFKTTNAQFKNAAIFISKILSLKPLTKLNPVSYLYKVHKPLLQFRSVLSKLSSYASDLITTNIIALELLNHDDLDKFQRDNKAWRKLATEIPFKKSLPNVLLGIIAQEYLETYLLDLDSTKAAAHVNESPIKNVHDNPVQEFLKSLKFVKQVIALVRTLLEKKLLTVDEAFKTMIDSSEELILKLESETQPEIV